ncbi:non-ribosomal peptide synthetase [Micromonospora sp. NBC_00421]|uniref:non-ribosomal peptide synthetase n=1 Tax=Micromonospora sp. NBC_00421 TaxID=2975976 RepID=UPI002E21B080|nr:non-ribosomal peptide synthetase [Micromonospora sp. NBC_00421]
MIAGSVQERFEAQVRLTPGAVALTGYGEELSYAALNATVNRLAHHLVTRGLRAGQSVALALPRDTRFAVGMLAVLKAGGAYLPIEEGWSEERVDQAFGAAGPALALGSGADGPTARVCARTDVPFLDLADEGLRAAVASLSDHDPASGSGRDPLDPACLLVSPVAADRPQCVVLSQGELVRLLAENGPGGHPDAGVARAEVPAADLIAPLLTGAAVRLGRAPAGVADGSAEERSVTPAPGASEPGLPPLARRSRPAAVPMSFGQRRLWFLDQLEGPQRTYHLPLVHRLRGPLDRVALRSALGDVVARHEALRTVLREVDGEPVQVVLPVGVVHVDELTCSEADLDRALDRAVEHTFDLSEDVPLRVTVITTGPDDHLLVLLFHHVGFDAWSRGPLTRDLSVAYRARLVGRVPEWVSLPVQYADFALWQREVLGGEGDVGSVVSVQLGYWSRVLAGLPVELGLPVDRLRPVVGSGRGGGFVVEWGGGLGGGLVELARLTGSSLSMVAHAGLAVVLTRLGVGGDVPIGVPVGGRSDVVLGDLVGCFLNTVVVRVDTSGGVCFRGLVGRVREASLGAFAHPDVPFERVVEVVNPPRSAARNPLFQIMLHVEDDEPTSLLLDGVVATELPQGPRLGALDLAINLRCSGARGEPGPVTVEVEFALDLFDQPTVRQLVDRLRRVLQAVVAQPDQRIDQIDILGREERDQLLRQGTGARPDRVAFGERTLQEAFRRQAERSPDAIAVRCAGRSLTYRELDERSNRLAHRLRAAGVGPERPVATLLDRTVDLVVALTAILKAGGFYVPLHHASPLDRMQWVLGECGAEVLLTDEVMRERGLPVANRVISMEDPETDGLPSTDPEVTGHRAQLAYVMYTSGSTGAPKGVAITHDDVFELISDSIFTPGDHDRVLLLTPYEFDPSTYSFWYPLLHGGTAVIAPEADLTVERLARLMRQEQITGVDVTAGLFRVMAEEHPECFADVRVVITGGDIVSPVAVRKVLEHCPGLLVRSNYGPTETTLFATSAPWRRAADVPAPVPIGRPLDGMCAYVLDQSLSLVPSGVVGDLYLAGAGLARGYLKRSDLTAERFVADPFGPPGTRMYHTGDRVRWTPDGLLDFAGRADGQVKIRGFRIELPEIEAVLAAVPGVRQVAVVAREDQPGDKRLVAYVVSDADLDDALERQARQRLPEYMVPAAVVRLDRLPLTANNKVDHRALPAPALAPRGEIRPPRDVTEAVLCDLFADLLPVDRVGIDDNLFDLGGHSLLATRLVSRIRTAFSCELAVRAVFEAPTPAGLAVLVKQAPAARPALLPATRPERVPLSFAQRRLWFLHRLEGRSAAYTLPLAVRLTGRCDPAALEAALGDVVARHENLRTIFPEIDGHPCQVVLPAEQARPALPVERVDDVQAALREAARVSFDPTVDVPMRARLFTDGPDEHVLLLALNHIGSDGWSMRPLARDLHDAYAARLAGRAPTWEPLPVQYADYTLWQQTMLGTEDDPTSLAHRQLDHWRRVLDGCVEELELPTDHPRPAAASYRGARLPLSIGTQAHRRLVELARATNATVFMVLHAALATLLHRFGAGTDIPIGTPVAGRTDAALDDLIGFFVNTLVLRVDLADDPTFTELLARVRRTDLAAYEHQEVPFELVVEAVNPSRSLARNPLFQVMLEVSIEFDRYRVDLPGLDSASQPLDTESALFDLLFTFDERYLADGSPAGLNGVLEYSTDLFRPDTARLIAERFRVVLDRLVARPDQRLSEVDLFLDGERDRVLRDWHGTRVELPRTPLPDLLQRQAARTPDAVAVSAHDGQLTYAELNERANRLAHLLLSEGVGPGTFVGVALRHSSQLVVTFLAVIKAGAAYLPIDVTYPQERIRFILDDTRPTVLLTTEADAGMLPATVWTVDGREFSDRVATFPTHDPSDAERPAPVSWETPHYVVFTSGSTGRPKGVLVPTRVLINEVAWNTSVIPYEPGSRVAQFGSVGFDISEYEMLMALLGGKTLCVPDENTRLDLTRFAGWLDRERITEFNAPDLVIAAVYEAAAEQGLRLDSLRHVIQGGEALQLTARVREFHAARPALTLHNQYGPSETHFVTGTPLPADVADWPATPSIGTPVWNTRIHVLDERLRPVPVGVPGELYMAGDCLAHSYHDRPDLTAARFVADPFGDPGGRMYRSGDLGRWRGDGTLDFLGRVDDQVKIRGVRVELGELNAVLATHPKVAQAATVLRQDRPGDKRLVAYVVATPDAPAPSVADLRRHVGAAVPEAVVPAAFVLLDALPINANGKLDRRALPVPDYGVATVESRRPVNPAEEILCGLFAEVLEVDAVGVDDNFFELGGHSLLVTRLISRVRATLAREFPVRLVFEASTPAELARRLDGTTGARPPLTAGPRPLHVPMSYAQQRLWFLNQLEGPSATYNLPVTWRLSGPLDVTVLTAALTDVVTRHETLRTVLREVDGQPVQVVLPAGPVPVHRIRCVEADLDDVLRDDFGYAFDLSGEPPIRVSLVTLDGTDDHVLVILLHHVVGDGWSMRPLARDLAEAYRARATGGVPQWTPLPVQYADYALWQREALGGEDDPGSAVSRQLGYWTRTLADLPVELTYPTDRPRPAASSGRGEAFVLDLGSDLHERMAELARVTGTTLAMVAHAAMAAVLTRSGAGVDIPLGTPVAGRADEALDGLIGFFANTLVMRIDTAGDPTFRDLLARVRDTSLAAYEHQDVPFERIVEALNPPRSAGRNPLFQIMQQVSFDGEAVPQLPGLDAEELPAHLDAARFDISMMLQAQTVAGRPGPMRAIVRYAVDLFDASSIRRLFVRLVRMLTQVSVDPDQPISAIELLDEEERTRLVRQGTGDRPVVVASAGRTLPTAFREQADRTPQAVAVHCAGQTLTYRDLDGRANRLAHRLLAAGGRPGQRMAMALEPSVEAVVAALAILKVGGCCVPLRPQSPPAQLRRALERHDVRLLVADGAMAGRTPHDGPVVVRVDEVDPAEPPATDPGIAVDPGQHAFVTGSSTTEPTDLVLTHGEIVELVADPIFTPAVHGRLLLVTPYGFEPSSHGLWYPLLHGGTTIVAATDDMAAEQIGWLVEDEEVTAVDLPAGLFAVVAEERPECLSQVREVLVRGPVPPADEIRRVIEHCPGIRVRTYHGPAGGFPLTLSASWDRAVDVPVRVPLGRPRDGIAAYLLDDALALVPDGVVGQLYLTGPHLPQAGPSLDGPGGFPAQVPVPVYPTGHRCRWNSTGVLEYVGDPATTRWLGSRHVDLREVEAVLDGCPGVVEVAVAASATPGGERRVVAYVVGDEEFDPAGPDEHARRLLPEYLVPGAVVALDELPRTVTGELDHARLPLPDGDGTATGRGPASDQEEILCGLFAEALGVDDVGVDDSFFDLGGHSLLATHLVSLIRSAFDCELTVRAVFEAPTPAELARRLDVTGQTRPALTARDRPDRLPMSYAQQRLWFLHQIEGPSSTYNMPFIYRLSGRLDADALQLAFADVVARHEVLRTVLREVDGQPVQVVLPPAPQELRRSRCAEAALAEVLQQAVEYTFDLSTEPAVRASLITLDDSGDHVLMILFHHSATDGLSAGPFGRDLSVAYRARLVGRVPEWVSLPVQYADFALWQREVLGGEGDVGSVVSVQLGYWSRVLAGLPVELGLPVDRLRPVVGSGRGGGFVVEWGGGLGGGLVELARLTGSSLSMVAHAGLAVVLTRLGVGGDVPIGVPVGGRSDVVLGDLVGCFLNTVVVRVDTSGGVCFRGLVGRVREASLGAFAHQDVPFERVVEVVNPPRSAARNPLFQIMQQVVFTGASGLDLPGVRAERLTAFQQREKFDLSLTLFVGPPVDGRPGPIEVFVRYAVDLFDESTVRRLIDRLFRVLESVVADPTIPISAIDILDADERTRVLTGWNDTAAQPPTTARSIASLFEEQVARTPDAVALVCDGQRLSYAALDDRANRLARHLTTWGVGPEAVVGLCLPRGVEMVTSILAVWKAGAAYLPIDPAYPAERTAFMLTDSSVAVLVGTRADLPAAQVPMLALDDPSTVAALASVSGTAPRVPVAADGLAYVIYTSGSTGSPKGVAVTHGSLVNYATFVPGRLGWGEPGSRYALLQPQVTDLGNTVLYTSLVTGGELHVLDADTATDPAAVAGYLAAHRIDHMKVVPSHLAALAADHGMGPVLPAGSLVLGGEAAPPELVETILAAAGERVVHNHYGPTEATIGAVTGRLTTGSANGGAVPIGTPIANTRTYVLDDALGPVPPGVTGDLYIAGDALARGYVGRPDLTAERFVACPFETGRRMYRTGDRARWTVDGQLVFAGRADDQVKIRGYRVEPGEVRAVLLTHPEVAQAAVVARADRPGDVRLVAYVVAADGVARPEVDPLPALLRRFLGQRLPAHLVPAAVMVLERLPLTANGKLDQQALPAAYHTGGSDPDALAATLQEQLMCDLFAEVLGLERVGVEDNFFDCGGHSLLAIRLVTRIRTTFDSDLSVRAVFEAPDPRRLARYLVTGGLRQAFDVVYPIRPDGSRTPLFCMHSGGGLSWVYSGLLRHLDPDIPLYGIQSVAMAGTGLRPGSVVEMAREYVGHIRAVQPRGPYRVIGWSLGGVLAHEVAVQLQEAGEEVSLLGILDTNMVFDPDAVGSPVPEEHLRYEPGDPTAVAEEIRQLAGGTVPTLNLLHGHEQRLALSAYHYHRQVRRRHVPRVYRGDVLFFRATADKGEPIPAESTWGPYVDGGFEEIHIACTHYQLLAMAPLVSIGSAVSREPLATIGEALNKALRPS